jgi:Protein of unknown function (DUF2911)
MNFSKLTLIAGFIIAFALIFELAAHADEENQSTKLTFSQSVQVPGRILPAGTYEFVLANSPSDRDIVQIFNADGTELFATIQTVPTDRAKETTGTSITLAQGRDGQPAALVTWFYPGTETGHEFVYSKQVETKLAQDAKETFVEEHGTMVNSDANRAGN